MSLSYVLLNKAKHLRQSKAQRGEIGYFAQRAVILWFVQGSAQINSPVWYNRVR